MKNEAEKDKGTFIVKIYNRKNATWQGSVTWTERQKEQYFRSALELLKMIESALDYETGKTEPEEGGYYEEEMFN